jgi:hypothetical protein
MKKVFSHFGGGYVHYCGRNPHLFEVVMGMPDVRGINLGNPEMHDMEYVLRRCAEAGKIYYGIIPRNEESVEEYFIKYLNASKAGDKSVLLLSYACKKEEREEVLEVWEYACRQTQLYS